MRDVNRPDLNMEKKPSKLGRVFVVLLVTMLLLAGTAYGALYILFSGHFVHAAAAFVQDVGHTFPGDIALNLFITDEERQVLMGIDPGTGIAAGEQKMFSVHPQLG